MPLPARALASWAGYASPEKFVAATDQMTRTPVNPAVLTRAREQAGLVSLALAGQGNAGATPPKEGPHE